jgi:hypothetical protein
MLDQNIKLTNKLIYNCLLTKNSKYPRKDFFNLDIAWHLRPNLNIFYCLKEKKFYINGKKMNIENIIKYLKWHHNILKLHEW